MLCSFLSRCHPEKCWIRHWLQWRSLNNYFHLRATWPTYPGRTGFRWGWISTSFSGAVKQPVNVSWWAHEGGTPPVAYYNLLDVSPEVFQAFLTQAVSQDGQSPWYLLEWNHLRTVIVALQLHSWFSRPDLNHKFRLFLLSIMTSQ